MVKILSFDCANKSLAWSYIEINLNIRTDLAAAKALINDCIIGNNAQDCISAVAHIRAIMARFVVFESCGVSDILCGQKLIEVSNELRTRALYDFLIRLNVSPDIVLIERQPEKLGSKINSGAIAVSNQICYHYIATSEVHFVSPKLKNALSFHAAIDYEYFFNVACSRMKELRGRILTKEEISRCKYTAAKKHSAENFLYFIKIFGLSDTIIGVKAMRYPDLADSFLQIIAWLKSQNMI